MTRILTIAWTVWLEMLRRKDIYVLLILLTALLLALLSVDIFGLGGVTGYVKDLGLLFAWLFAWILSVIVTARQLPSEEKQGTIYSLLAKPITRSELIVGKWLGSWSVVAAATLCFYGVLTGVVYLRGGMFRWDTLVQGCLLHLGVLAIICSLALALSTRMNFDAAVTFCFAVTAGTFLIVPRVPDLLIHAEGIRGTALSVLYSILPHFELFDMRQRLAHDGIAVKWTVVGLVMLYAVNMLAVFLLTAWLGYARKKFSRGETL